MKKSLSILMTIAAVLLLLCSSGFAYTNISAADALAMYNDNDKLIVVDVREKATEYCFGHIPCAVNLPLRSGVFEREYKTTLPQDQPLLLVCHSGSRSRQAAAILTDNGYDNVYTMAGGMDAWTGDVVTCEEDENCRQYCLYFPHIASGSGWETEIAIINTDPKNVLTGSIKAYSDSGILVGEPHPIELPPAGRLEITVGSAFSNPGSISYLVFGADSDKVCGYTKFYGSPDSSYRVAIPASAKIDQENLYISHLAITKGWWTGLNLLNPTSKATTLTITFNNGLKKQINLAAGAHKAINMAEFLSGESLEKIQSAIISNACGIVGFELFGRGNLLSGILLSNAAATTLYYPHIACDQLWWTGISAFNPGTTPGEITIKPYSDKGALAPEKPITMASQEHFVKSVSELNLPAETVWMAIEASIPISGFELFGTTDSLQLGGYSNAGITGTEGIFPKLDHSGWTGVALVNTTAAEISVTLKAYKDDGRLVDSKVLNLKKFQKIVQQPQDIFDNNIDTATYITYNASAVVAAFQLNGDGKMLDALPGR